ncbi:MAG: BspA family leucine-rich repeat surface protein [Bacilli bacterium]|nr:BspA family leucine-rich repeat surface protein [Bacilli bacterium]
MNKYKLYMIFGIVLLGLSITGSLAYYIWSSSTTSISGNLCLPEIYFTGGATINGKLKPVSSKEEGLIKEIEVNLHKTCNNDTAVMNLYLSLDLLPAALQENTFVYELYNGNNERISSGNFSNKKQGDIITLAENEIVTSNVSIYTLYIYIDGNRDNPITMTNQNFRFNIYGEGTGAIYKENVIQNETTTPSSSTSTFLNTEVLRNQIESITIEKTNVVPNNAKYSKDISSKQDGSVMLWYTDKDNNSLYEISIGSENGSVEANTNGSGMFAYLDNVSSLDLSGLDTSNMTSMSRMFYNSKSLTNIDLSGFDTSKVVTMSYMFDGCTNLENLDVTNFNTSKVTNMYWMFSNLKKVTSLDLSNFNTKMVTNMFGLFRYCSSLKELDVSNFNTSMVKTMTGMFLGCKSLIKLDLSNFDTSNVTDMSSIFQECTNLKELNLSSFNTSNVTNMRSMFQNCGSLTNIDVSSFDTSKVVNMSNMFSGVIVRTLDLLNFDTSKVTIMSGMFGDAKILSINLSSFDTSSVTDMSSMFYGCENLTKLDLSNFDTSKVTKTGSPYGMFYGCSNLKTIYVSDLWNMSNVTNSENMFRDCRLLTGAVPFDSTKTDATMANYTTGYLTYKKNTN